MKKEVIPTDLAETDIKEAAIWHEDQRIDLGTEFLKSFEETLEFVSLHPKSCQKKYKNFTGATIHLFPCIIIYEEEKNNIVVYRVFPRRESGVSRNE